jgi:hypothetical protein
MTDIQRLSTLLGSAIVKGALTITNFESGTWMATAYDFAVDGGAISSIPLGITIPNNTLIWGGFLRVITAGTSGGSATIALTTGQTAGDILAATAFNNAGIDTAGKILKLAPITTPILTTAARIPNFVIAGATLGAGKYQIILQTIQLPIVP